MKQYEKWMPLYIADYLADTSRLTLEQHGAYLLLIMDYWRNGAPPDDHVILARIVGASPEQWRAIAPVLHSLFHDEIRGGSKVWAHKRIDEELGRAKGISKIRAEVAANRHAKEHAKNMQLHTPSPSPSHIPLPEPLPEPKATSKAIRASRLQIEMKMLTDLDVDEQHATDWLVVRKAKNAPLTPTAVKRLKAEAEKAGITVSEAVAICAERSWQSFKASWDWRGNGYGGNGRETVAEHNERARQEFLAKQVKTVEGETFENQ